MSLNKQPLSFQIPTNSQDLFFSSYKYHFPFLNTNGIVTVDDNRVGPLYQHIFPPVLAPWLSFVGLPWKVYILFKFIQPCFYIPEKEPCFDERTILVVVINVCIWLVQVPAPFPLFEFQCKWIAGVLSSRLALPSPEEMMAEVEAFYSKLKASGVPKRYTHNVDFQVVMA